MKNILATCLALAVLVFIAMGDKIPTQPRFVDYPQLPPSHFCDMESYYYKEFVLATADYGNTYRNWLYCRPLSPIDDLKLAQGPGERIVEKNSRYDVRICFFYKKGAFDHSVATANLLDTVLIEVKGKDFHGKKVTERWYYKPRDASRRLTRKWEAKPAQAPYPPYDHAKWFSWDPINANYWFVRGIEG